MLNIFLTVATIILPTPTPQPQTQPQKQEEQITLPLAQKILEATQTLSLSDLQTLSSHAEFKDTINALVNGNTFLHSLISSMAPTTPQYYELKAHLEAVQSL